MEQLSLQRILLHTVTATSINKAHDTIQHYEKPCGYTPSLLPFLVTMPCCFPQNLSYTSSQRKSRTPQLSSLENFKENDIPPLPNIVLKAWMVLTLKPPSDSGLWTLSLLIKWNLKTSPELPRQNLNWMPFKPICHWLVDYYRGICSTSWRNCV